MNPIAGMDWPLKFSAAGEFRPGSRCFWIAGGYSWQETGMRSAREDQKAAEDPKK
jgi:hypothetical protein